MDGVFFCVYNVNMDGEKGQISSSLLHCYYKWYTDGK